MRKIKENEYKELVAKSKAIEADSFGEKVLQFPNGNYMKLFRRKRLFSSALFYPYWLRFIHHISKLRRLGIPTLKSVIEVVKIPHAKKVAVIYEPLPGFTIKELLQSSSFDDKLIKKFGVFVANLHKKGVYFSSLHLGNVVLTPKGDFGLIDISDLRTFPFAIPLFALKTNMQYLFQSRQGLQLINDESKIDIFISAYVKNITERNKAEMTDFLITQKIDS
ncbi:MAG: toluene tolerance protein [Chlamydiae bacterium]|nr:MAG: toluene tolerance protein [Chlamydiota bacterium]